MNCRIYVTNNDTGTANQLQTVSEGMSIEQYFKQHLPGCKFDDYRVRLNEENAGKFETLWEGSRLSISRAKLAGAAKPTVEDNILNQSIRQLLANAQASARGANNAFVTSALDGLSKLDRISPQHVDEAVGLIDGTINLCDRYAGLVVAERSAVAAASGGEYDGADEVPADNARMVPNRCVVGYLRQTRAHLDVVRKVLRAPAQPATPTGSVPVPTGPGGSTGAAVPPAEPVKPASNAPGYGVA